MSMMKVEPLKLKSLGEGLMPHMVGGARVFIPTGKPAEPEAPPPPPTFSEADMKTAERDGFQKGFFEGTKEGHQQAQSEQSAINAQIAALNSNFASSMTPILRHYQQFVIGMQQEMPKVAMAIAQKVAGAAISENAAALVGDIAARACETMVGEAKLTITAHESLGDALEKNLQQLAARLPEHTEIIIMRDPNIPLADCRIDWKLGSMNHSIADLWTRVEKAVGDITALAARDAATDMQALEQRVANPTAEEPAPVIEEPDNTKNETKE